MLKKFILLSLAIVIASSLFSCEEFFVKEDGPTDKVAPIGQEILFEIQYVSHGWGYKLKGLYVDNSGNCYSYSLEPNSDVWRPIDNDNIHRVELMSKYNNQKKLIKKVDIKELNEMHFLLDAIKSAESTESATGCADYGMIYYIIYDFDYESNTYQPTIALGAGDMAVFNSAPEALELFNWLRLLSQDYSNPECLPDGVEID